MRMEWISEEQYKKALKIVLGEEHYVHMRSEEV